MSYETLQTASEIIDALGGNGQVAELTLSRPNAVSNWRAFNSFPPNTYIVMTSALAQIGKTAPASLWRMKATAEAST